jgi:LmbE family N-acetylglucosaminyl deacetylase
MYKHPGCKIFQVLINLLLIRILVKVHEIDKLGDVVFIAPHPDDELFGIGGSVLKMLENEARISLIYLTDGEGSGVWPNKEGIGRQRIRLSEQFAARLGIVSSNIYRLHLTDGAVPHPGQAGFEEAVKNVKELLDIIKPDAIFATHPLDYWPFDHVACAEIAIEAVRQSETKPQLWYYWVWAWYNVRPWKLPFNNLKKLQKIDISDHLDRKKELMNIYLEAKTPDGKPWSGILPKSLLRAFYNQFEVVEMII